jgi:hypothetical protein
LAHLEGKVGLLPLAQQEKEICPLRIGRCPSCNHAEGPPNVISACARSRKRHELSARRVGPGSPFLFFPQQALVLR